MKVGKKRLRAELPYFSQRLEKTDEEAGAQAIQLPGKAVFPICT
jgi:hypothetical protein